MQVAIFTKPSGPHTKEDMKVESDLLGRAVSIVEGEPERGGGG